MKSMANVQKANRYVKDEVNKQINNSLYLYTIALCISVLDKTDIDKETLHKILYETQELFDGINGGYVGFEHLLDELENDHHFIINWKK